MTQLEADKTAQKDPSFFDAEENNTGILLTKLSKVWHIFLSDLRMKLEVCLIFIGSWLRMQHLWREQSVLRLGSWSRYQDSNLQG